MRRLRRERATLNPDRPDWTRNELDLLGTMPDKELAEKLGGSSQAVRRKRNQLKIAPPQKSHGRWKRTPSCTTGRRRK